MNLGKEGKKVAEKTFGPDHPKVATSLYNLKVLLVEDHERQREVMVQMLELYGYEVDVACNGEEGVKKTQEWHPDIVLMDIRMPGRIDGLEAIRRLRSGPDTADIPIIAISAWGGAEHKGEALEAGADAFFKKPVTMDVLIATINHHLRKAAVEFRPTIQPKRRQWPVTKVLYVEDHEVQRDIMVQVLERYGYEVDVACNGEEGVKKTQEWHPDIVLMDIRMPGRIDGLVAIRLLRDSPDTADIPIIVLSAWGRDKHVERALKAGADAHLTKPVPIDELIAAINHHLRKAAEFRPTIQPKRRQWPMTKVLEEGVKKTRRVVLDVFYFLCAWAIIAFGAFWRVGLPWKVAIVVGAFVAVLVLLEIRRINGD